MPLYQRKRNTNISNENMTSLDSIKLNITEISYQVSVVWLPICYIIYFHYRTTILWVILAFLFPLCVCLFCRTRNHWVFFGLLFLPCCLLKTTNRSRRSMNFLLLNLPFGFTVCSSSSVPTKYIIISLVSYVWCSHNYYSGYTGVRTFGVRTFGMR